MALEFSPETHKKFEEVVARYPRKEAAMLPVLYLAQREFGYVSVEGMEYVAALLGVSPTRVYEVATFYTMYNKQPVGKYFIQVCTNICCALRGGMDLFAYLSKKLAIAEGQTTKDGRFTLVKVECLGACGNAPMMQVNDDYYEDLTPAKVDELLKSMT